MESRLGVNVRSAAVAACALALALLLSGAGLLAGAAQAQEEDGAASQVANQAMLVVQLEDGSTRVRTVDFTAPISGLAALKRSGLEVVTADMGFGEAVCSIAGTGCPAEDCFCGGDRFWNYSSWDGAAWQSYAVGAADSVITETGSIEGWRWGAFEGTQPGPAAALAAERGLEWLDAAQGAAGGFEESMGATAEALVAIGANGGRAAAWRTAEGVSIQRFVARNGEEYAARGVAESGKLAVGVAAGRACWPEEARRPSDYYSDTLGAYSTETGFHIWGVLGALALGEDVPEEAVALIEERALADGGWEWSPEWGADTNTTALAVQALVAAGRLTDTAAIQAALDYLEAAQNDDGGFGYQPQSEVSAASDVNSTAYVVQALAAAGEDVLGERWTRQGRTAVDFLLSAQLDDGSFEWQPGGGANGLATMQAAAALLGRPLPITAERVPLCRGIWGARPGSR